MSIIRKLFYYCKEYVVIFLFVNLFGLFWYQSISLVDVDFGWHIRMGQIILKYGIPTGDSLSYTMKHFHYIDHEWGMDVIYAYLYPHIGFIGLGALTSAIIILSLWIIVSINTQQRCFFLPLLLGSAVLLNFISIRPHVVTWLGVALLLKLSSEDRLWKRWRRFIPVSMVIWANLHGGFVAGLIFLLIMGISKHQLSDVCIIVLSFFATLFNPYGIRLWYEVFGVISTGSFRWTIQEWAPALFTPNIALEVFFVFSVFFVWQYRRQFSFISMIFYGIWLSQGLISQRHIPLWIFCALPLTIIAFSSFVQDVTYDSVAKNRLKHYMFVVYIFSSLLVIWESNLVLLRYGWDTESVYYPKKAISYLREHPSAGQLFSSYSWGGYLDWKYSEKAVFIDGRMAGWGEGGKNIFEEYTKLETGKLSFDMAEKTYNIDTILWPRWDFPQSDKFSETLQVKPHQPFLQYVLRNGWKPVYIDSTSVVLRK